MGKTHKKRLNLYISEDIILFAKKWSYVNDKPISKMLEEHLIQQREIVSTITPFQWLNDPHINSSLPPEDKKFSELEEYINNREEEKFCTQNPDHPRAKIRRTLVKEHEQYVKEKMGQQKKKEKDLIRRWMEVFSMK